MYCSPLWRPYLLKDIDSLERVQRHATKFILSDYTSDYKTRLKQLSILPLMYTYDIADITFFVNSIKNPSPRFNILKYVDFLTGSTRSAGSKLHHKIASTNSIVNSYFYRLPKLWNRLPIIDLSRSLHEIKLKYFWNHSLIVIYLVHFSAYVLVPTVPSFLLLVTITKQKQPVAVKKGRYQAK